MRNEPVVGSVMLFLTICAHQLESADLRLEHEDSSAGKQQHCLADNGQCGGMHGKEWELMCVEKVLVINLKRRADKWAKVQQRLREAGFQHVERVDAVDGRELPMERIQQVLSEDAWSRFGKEPASVAELGEVRTLGAVGCFLSHLLAWQHVAESGARRALILEDDVEFAPSSRYGPAASFHQHARHVFHGAQTADTANQRAEASEEDGEEEGGCSVWWDVVDVVLLGFHDGDDHRGQPHVPLTVQGGRRPGSGGALFACAGDPHRWRGHAYVLTQRAAAALASEALPITHQLDYFLALLHASGHLSCVSSMYELITEPTTHIGEETDVQNPDTEHVRHLLPAFASE